MTAEHEVKENLSGDIGSIRNQDLLDDHILSEQEGSCSNDVTEETKQNGGRVPGYNETYNRIWGRDDEMSDSVINEDQQKSPRTKGLINLRLKDIINLLWQ